jgi:phage terminase large subunit-like protein
MRKTINLILPEPHSGQQYIVESKARFRILACGRRFGKTTIGGNLIIEKALPGYPTAWFAPTYKDLADVWREIRQYTVDITKSANASEHRIELITGGAIDMWSLENKDAGRGRKYKFIVIDEAAKAKNLEETWNEAIRPTLTDYQGGAAFLSTPKGMNFFWRCFTRG